MKILILSFYYYPDLCAGSFRCSALVNQLKQLLPDKWEIDVITTAPNRYASFKAEAHEVEQQPGLRIQRVTLPAHDSGMLDQAKAFVHFFREVNNRVKDYEYTLVFATSSRLMTAALGAWVARKKNAKLYLDIRDIFADAVQYIVPKKMSFFIKPIFSYIERWSVTRAQRVNLVSRGFEEYFNKRYPQSQLRWFTNGIDPEFVTPMATTAPNHPPSKLLTVLYAGNLGEGQGLHAIIPALAKRFEERVNFRIIGDGGRKRRLEEELHNAQCKNVVLLPPIQRMQLIAEYQQADVLFLHLNDYDAFRKVLPSKLFEYAAIGKPIWAGLSGYSADFVKSEISNAAVFYPCNVLAAEKAFYELILNDTARINFIEKYHRNSIMRDMAADILSLV